ncbi:MAG: chemotaxis protein CheW [Oryzomonas sp.]|uniref:chemotaxis protein CheW n=1 Tax=Oryzomonas sp. TaxID=2855186 RepID=UPI00284F6D44|nr:chemotaxis protein CheW [Oryzomonas sp.]MDR3581355.1 chemotaxis protein CheW [Oryzomonas sp.]
MSTALVAIKPKESNGDLTQMVSFSLSHEEYGVEVLKVREIIRMAGITHIPNAPHYLEGIINLRGKVIPVISMRKRFGMMEQEHSTQTRIIIMDIEGELMGFIVDAVSEVIRISAGEIQPPPATVADGGEQECIAGVINRSDRLLVLLDLDRIFSREEKQLFA